MFIFNNQKWHEKIEWSGCYISNWVIQCLTSRINSMDRIYPWCEVRILASVFNEIHVLRPGADPGFQVRGGAQLQNLRRSEVGAKILGVFRVKNHDFTPKNHIFSNFRGGRARRGLAPGAHPPPPGSAPGDNVYSRGNINQIWLLKNSKDFWII
jgi:hypothetical protein